MKEAPDFVKLKKYFLGSKKNPGMFKAKAEELFLYFNEHAKQLRHLGCPEEFVLLSLGDALSMV